MKRVIALIDKAAKVCGNYSELAKRLSVGRSTVSMWRSEKQPIPSEHLAEMCEIVPIAGDEARQLLAISEANNPKKKKYSEVMSRVFFGCLALGVLVLGTCATRADANGTNSPTANISQSIHWRALRDRFTRALRLRLFFGLRPLTRSACPV